MYISYFLVSPNNIRTAVKYMLFRIKRIVVLEIANGMELLVLL
ncbi:hypothetical protein SanJ4206_0308 [Streptococcus anginosus]|nr:hypothetical protein SanJ4206_0308 [Streptococcus anginosus]